MTSILLGAAAGHGLVLASSPILTRLYDPSDFGALTVFTALAGILAAVSTLRLEAAIPLPRQDADAAAVAWAALCAVGGLSVALAVVAGLSGGPVSRALNAEALHRLWWLLPVTVLAIGVSQVLSAWMVRERRYSALGVRNAAQGFGQTLAQTVTGVLGLRPLGLLIGVAAGRLAGCGGLASRHGLLRQPKVTGRQMAEIVRRYRRFPLMSTWSALFNSVGLHGPLLILAAAYGQVAIGLAGLTVRVLAMPVALIGQAVATHYLGEASALVRAGTTSLHRTLTRTAGRLLLVGVVPAGVLLLFGPPLFGAVFGSAWTPSGEYARVLALGCLAQFVVNPVSQTLNVLERQGQQLRWDVARSVLTLGGVLACAATGVPIIVALLLLSGSHVVAYGWLYLYCARAAARHDAACASAPETPVRCRG
ncbi:lipopolysaccharide biosynthesis protein [Actinoplanes aureus]|uniref:Lipopolysaccharide biosynthesis protein n=1 Tax=Actinoplanes aureus TaxID=2792083 RepID=A0A931C6U7_9ACTN|nr:lipopolysaccharide biosynthesis protein [Actinoplanes aureus]MBG0562457.1 lipopolysaccharide biosynthesis protein [Actinoplanes aureus]